MFANERYIFDVPPSKRDEWDRMFVSNRDMVMDRGDAAGADDLFCFKAIFYGKSKSKSKSVLLESKRFLPESCDWPEMHTRDLK